MPLKTRLVLVGAGGFGREVLCWLEQSHGDIAAGGKLGFLDTGPDALDREDYPAEYLGSIDDFVPRASDTLVMAIGDPAAKRRVAELLVQRGGRFAPVIHRSAVIARTASIEDGAVICPLALISANVRIERFAAINVMSSVGHDTVVGAYATLSSHVDLTGNVVVGEQCFFGSGARVLPRTKIGACARIGAGAVIMRNVRAGATMYAPPARRL